ncbi:6-hydroxymethylpterin diphosphokinase MptE-like protein [Magnetospira sp. QH-2]|uniref:motility associated factor glycosyltransferase family protein n=1 Tax=Magnetospira sp. (strain QH-2) TaxID=1288970 RepID=UPI00130E8692|nr:6-hydroxymethylpterin diphosphokinase MptE-like protein [Magnetospira sp. QH-2]
MPIPRTPLFERNVQVFEQRFADLWALLKGLDPMAAALVPGLEEPDNIRLGDALFYAGGATADTERQWSAYLDDPERLRVGTAKELNLSRVFREPMRAYTGFVNETVAPARMAPLPLVDVGYGFVFGLGLGLHVDVLIERTSCTNLVIFEPMPLFVLHSMYRIDWAALWEKAESAGRHLHLICTPDPEQGAARMLGLVGAEGRTFLEGSYIYHHYSSWQIQKAREIFDDRMKVAQVSIGFFEDELLMMKHTALNFLDREVKLITPRPGVGQSMPVLLVGSGPSLDQDMEALKALASRAVVFSCGTSLGILLKNGIRPDFHLETENTTPLVKNLVKWNREYGLDGIRFIASSSVAPQAVAAFAETWFFFRPNLSCSRLLNNGIEPLAAGGPLVTNAACDVALTLGFQELYLFGVDCGRHPTGAHHSKDAIYLEDDYDNYIPGESLDFIEDGFDRQVPGNFGGTMETSLILDMSRLSFQIAIGGHGGARAYNCSRGALIPGCQPRAAGSIKIPEPEKPKAAVLASLANRLRICPAGQLVDAATLNRLRKGASAFPPLIHELATRMKEEATTFTEVSRPLKALIEREDLVGFQELAGKSLFNALRAGSFVGSRIDDAAARRAALGVFLDQFSEAGHQMADSCLDLYDDLLKVAGE